MTTTKAILKKESPLREIWPEGRVPIKSPIVQYGKGREGENLCLYEVDLTLCSQAEINKILIKMREITDPNATQEDLIEEGFRIQLSHTKGFTMSMGIGS